MDDDEVPTEVLTVNTNTRTNGPKYQVTTIGENHVNLLVGGGKLLKQKLICNDVEVAAIVDTGAYVSVIDSSIVEHFNWNTRNLNMALVGADGNRLLCKGSVLLDITLTIRNVTKKKKHMVTVLKNLTAPMLLGLELMKEFGVVIDTVTNELRFTTSKSRNGVRLTEVSKFPPCNAEG